MASAGVVSFKLGLTANVFWIIVIEIVRLFIGTVNFANKAIPVYFCFDCVQFITIHFDKLCYCFRLRWSKRRQEFKVNYIGQQDDAVFLECQVQNITTGPVVMESVTLDPSPFYTVLDLNFKTVESRKSKDSR